MENPDGERQAMARFTTPPQSQLAWQGTKRLSNEEMD
jgi:hypothetical protein